MSGSFCSAKSQIKLLARLTFRGRDISSAYKKSGNTSQLNNLASGFPEITKTLYPLSSKTFLLIISKKTYHNFHHLLI